MTETETPALAALAAAWARFDRIAEQASSASIGGLFAAEPDRLERLRVDAAGLHLDLSKQSLTAEGLGAALALARAAGMEAARGRLFEGFAVNSSEDRAVLHPALRAPNGAGYAAKGEPVSTEVEVTRARMKVLAGAIRSGEVRGATGQRFRAIVHIGIGGSDLGPRLVWDALRPLDGPIELRFAANVDGAEMLGALHGLEPDTTLVVIVSKTFTTLETLANAQLARAWLVQSLGEAGARAHLAAVSAAPGKTGLFGIAPDRVFAFADWVGGRFSIWSAVGLSCAIALGFETFQAFLDGAAAMDDHFTTVPLERNAPVLMALAEVWNRNGLARPVRAVVPYARRLALLPAFLQQLEMESNGKRVTREGGGVPRATAATVFGDAGTNGQHAFFQLLHQGTDVIPVDLVLVAEGDGPPDMHAKLLANGIAQSEALMIGRPEAEVREELEAGGMDPAEIDALAPQRTFPGDRPTTTIVLPRVDAASLGALLALYEHKVFVEGVLWGINSFDQWGVELGKTLATRVLGELEGGETGMHDPSTAALIARFRG
ncbi:glucose-6-phosphate isomerase [Caulobacter sp. S45]|uniref:glucose-6-phosphate isomerase n=1 Tax=Caulobacter sp. S45 TaxID=1641861 RepID=UPI001575CE9D|nr:glucose-6-phosphate isomerase [Caulobacter sp. S45]